MSVSLRVYLLHHMLSVYIPASFMNAQTLTSTSCLRVRAPSIGDTADSREGSAPGGQGNLLPFSRHTLCKTTQAMIHANAKENCLSVNSDKRSSFKLLQRPLRMPIACSDFTHSRAS